MGFVLSLQITRGESVLGHYTFDSDTHRLIRVGQRPNDQLPIQDPTVQVRARITLSPHAATLTDLGTSGGIVVNGTRIRETQLRPNDDIAIGATRLLVTACASSYATPLAAAAPPLPPSPTLSDVTGDADRRLRVIGKIGTLPAGTLAEAEAFIDALATGTSRATPPPQVGSTPAVKPKSEPIPHLPDKVTIHHPATPWSDSTEPMVKPMAMPPPTPQKEDTPPPTKQTAGRSIFEPGKPTGPPRNQDGMPQSLTADFTHQTSLDQSKVPAGSSNAEPLPTSAPSVQRERYDTSALVDSMHGHRRRNRAVVGLVVAAVIAVVVYVVLRRPSDSGAMTGSESLSAFVDTAKTDAAEVAAEPSGTGEPDAAAATTEKGAGGSNAEPGADTKVGSDTDTAAGAPDVADIGTAEAAVPTEPTPKEPEAAPPTAAPSPPEGTVTHQLTATTSLPDLATELWGNPENAALIAEQNEGFSTDGTLIPSGTIVNIPTSTLYTVKAGDTLGLIAKEFLGNPLHYSVIYEANKDTMTDPSDVEVGSTLVIPLLPPEIAAKLHSR